MNGRLEKTLFRKPMVVLSNIDDFYTGGDRITEKTLNLSNFVVYTRKKILQLMNLQTYWMPTVFVSI